MIMGNFISFECAKIAVVFLWNNKDFIHDNLNIKILNAIMEHLQ